jgi:hypothetical protein
VRQKLSTIELEFKGKNVLLVDDSMWCLHFLAVHTKVSRLNFDK